MFSNIIEPRTYPNDAGVLSCLFNGRNGANGYAVVSTENQREIPIITFL